MINIIAIVLTLVNIIGILNTRNKNKISLKKATYRQSTLHHMAKLILPSNAELKSIRPTQFNRYLNSKLVKVINAPDGKSYWVKNNKFYVCEIKDGEFDPSQGKEIDTAKMSKKEIDKLLLILDNLNRGNNNDIGGPRN
jgi:hypothetical protein